MVVNYGRQRMGCHRIQSEVRLKPRTVICGWERKPDWLVSMECGLQFSTALTHRHSKATTFWRSRQDGMAASGSVLCPRLSNGKVDTSLPMHSRTFPAT